MLSATGTQARKLVTKVPARLEPFGQTGWTVFGFATATEAAAWVASNPRAAMPCWRRFDVVDGDLVLAR